MTTSRPSSASNTLMNEAITEAQSESLQSGDNDEEKLREDAERIYELKALEKIRMDLTNLLGKSSKIKEKALANFQLHLNIKNNERMLEAIRNSSTQIIDQNLLNTDHNGNNLLTLTANRKCSCIYPGMCSCGKIFPAILHKATESVIYNALLHKNNLGETTLSIAAKNEKNRFIASLIKILNPKPLSAALIIEDSDHETPLSLIAKHHSHYLLAQVIDKIKKSAINTALVIKNNNNDTPLSLIAMRREIPYSYSYNLDSFLKKADKTAVQSILIVKNKDNETALSLAASKPSAFEIMLNLATPEMINVAIVSQNKSGESLLSRALIHIKSATTLIKLIQQISNENITSAMMYTLTNNQTGLHLAASRQSENNSWYLPHEDIDAFFPNLIKKTDIQVINRLLCIKDTNEETPLSLAFINAKSLILKTLFKYVNTQAVIDSVHLKPSAWTWFKEISDKHQQQHFECMLLSLIRSHVKTKTDQPSSNFLDEIKPYKTEVKNTILNLANISLKNELLKEATNPMTPLGAYFTPQTKPSRLLFFKRNTDRDVQIELEKAFKAITKSKSCALPPIKATAIA